MEKDFFSKHKVAIIILIVLAIIIISIIGMYNNFVYLQQNINAKWSEVENQYQRQADLIPNLVSTVSSAVKVEVSLLQNLTAARSAWANAKTPYEKDVAGVQMSNSLANFIGAVAVAENYPQLQANKQYTALMDELAGTQNRIATARTRYIEAIQKFNTAIKTFPGVLFAGLFGFKEIEYYKAEIKSLSTPQLGSGVLP
ncbi:MAG: LemA family protein [Candidatus Aenigmatarchaeota archaeon]|nr:LemA family protein [Candidatus Aenigmarchaeota archaeon]